MDAVADVGSCNTQLRFKNGTPRVEEVGIDTWRLARYLDDDQDLRRAVRLIDGRTFQKVEGHAVGVLPGYRMLWLEGHPAVEGLATPRTLQQAEERVLNGLLDLGLPTGRDGGLRRFDSTATLRFDHGAEGLAFMRGVAAVDLPRSKKAVYEGVHGEPQTVYILGPGRSRRVLGRLYDKGVESGTAPRGELIRLESQTRVGKEVAEYMTASAMTKHSGLAGSHFRNRFSPVAESVDGVHAATAPVLADRVAELVREGELTAAKGARLVGYLVCGDRLDLARTTQWRWRRELRAHGLVLVDPMKDQVDVDLGQPLEAALAAWEEQ